MKSSLRHKLTTILLCASLLLLPKSANADELKNDAIKAGVAIGLVGAAIGVGIYYLVRRAPSITGCAVSSPGGLSPERRRPADLHADWRHSQYQNWRSHPYLR